jgi:transposase
MRPGGASCWSVPLLRGSFVPPAAIGQLRDLVCYRKRPGPGPTAPRSSASRRPWKTPASNWTRSPPTCWASRAGRCSPALVAGERDPEVLAELARGRLRTKLPQLRQALRGRFSDHHALLRLALAHLEHPEAAIATLDGRIDEVIAPFARARDRLDTITGVGKRAAETIIAEIGRDADRARQRAVAQLQALATASPSNHLPPNTPGGFTFQDALCAGRAVSAACRRDTPTRRTGLTQQPRQT